MTSSVTYEIVKPLLASQIFSCMTPVNALQKLITLTFANNIDTNPELRAFAKNLKLVKAVFLFDRLLHVTDCHEDVLDSSILSREELIEPVKLLVENWNSDVFVQAVTVVFSQHSFMNI